MNVFVKIKTKIIVALQLVGRSSIKRQIVHVQKKEERGQQWIMIHCQLYLYSRTKCQRVNLIDWNL